jgi:hypothetical protein
VQAFQKIPGLKALDPTQTEAPFLITQLLTLFLVVVLTIIAAVKFLVDVR